MWGDPRHTAADYQNNNRNNNGVLRLTVASAHAALDSAELGADWPAGPMRRRGAPADREYTQAMRKVGLEGVQAMERQAKAKLEQRSMMAGLSALRRAFAPYDHNSSGTAHIEEFRKALEVAGAAGSGGWRLTGVRASVWGGAVLGALWMLRQGPFGPDRLPAMDRPTECRQADQRQSLG